MKIPATILFILIVFQLSAQVKIVVAIDGSGDFKTIQGAINSLPDSSATARTIFIKKGTYAEKLYIEKANIIFEGEDSGENNYRCFHCKR